MFYSTGPLKNIWKKYKGLKKGDTNEWAQEADRTTGGFLVCFLQVFFQCISSCFTELGSCAFASAVSSNFIPRIFACVV